MKLKRYVVGGWLKRGKWLKFKVIQTITGWHETITTIDFNGKKIEMEKYTRCKNNMEEGVNHCR